jgi:hypothetical protein
MAKAIDAVGSKANPEAWLGPYYQYANRLATLYFLTQHNIPSRLVFVYFTGDAARRDKKHVLCPKDKQEWDGYLKMMYEHLGIGGSSELDQRVHQLFLPVCAPTVHRPECISG